MGMLSLHTLPLSSTNPRSIKHFACLAVHARTFSFNQLAMFMGLVEALAPRFPSAPDVDAVETGTGEAGGAVNGWILLAVDWTDAPG
jgi:hypothetical protein